MRNTRKLNRVRRRFRVSLSGSSAFTIDVSPQGFCTEMLRIPPVGTPVQGSIRVKEAEYAFAGRVVWARPGDPRMNLRGRMGVSFTELPRSATSPDPFAQAIQ